MPVLSHLHQLFNAEQCQAYIRMLRWKERPLQCPRCQSHHIGQWGTYHYRPGCKRYWCHGGCAMPPYPMRCLANWQGGWTPMTSPTLPATRGKRKAVARSRWGAEHVAVVRSASQAGGIRTKTGRR
jgi:hypothetical protein